MKKAAYAVILFAGAALVVSGFGVRSYSGSLPLSAQAEEGEPLGENREENASQIDTSVSVVAGSRIAVVSKNVKGEFWELVHKGMEDAIKDINEAYGFSGDDELTMTFEGPDDEEDVETQVNTLDAVIAENPTVLCMSASDMDSCQAQLEAAAENGIPVIAFDSSVSENELITAFRGTDNEYVGQLAGEKLSEALPEGGKIAIFSVQEKTESAQKRVEGFKEAISERSDITIVSELYTDQVDDMTEAMQETLNSYPDLAGVFCTNADVADLYLDIEQTGDSQPVMIGVDATTKQQEAIRDGREAGTVSQAPYDMGYQTILVAAQATEAPAEEGNIEATVLLEPAWIDASNIDSSANSNYLYS